MHSIQTAVSPVLPPFYVVVAGLGKVGRAHFIPARLVFEVFSALEKFRSALLLCESPCELIHSVFFLLGASRPPWVWELGLPRS